MVNNECLHWPGMHMYMHKLPLETHEGNITQVKIYHRQNNMDFNVVNWPDHGIKVLA